jgi:CheY-like chemotaxis protein
MGLEELLEESRQRCLEIATALRDSEEARARAEHLLGVRDEFLSNLSHELRTPLNAIMGWAQILSERNVSPQDVADGAASIERNARTQAQLINDLQDFGRAISGKLRLDIQRMDLAEAIRAVVAAAEFGADAKGVSIETRIDCEACAMSGDAARLLHVVGNLVGNAIKFTPRGGHVRVSLRQVEAQMEIAVIDDGQGIAAEVLPGILDRFSAPAGESKRRRAGGLGISLFLVKRLVELHGGTVSAASAGENLGATFTILLPIGANLAAGFSGRGEPSRPAPGETDAPSLLGLTILVVDDEPDARELLRRLLERRGAEVVLAGGAREALEALRARRPDLIVSDIGMPGLDGYEMIRMIRALPAEEGGGIPAIALTAFARSEDRRRAMMAGFQAHIPKPIEPPELIATVAKLSARGNRSSS